MLKGQGWGGAGGGERKQPEATLEGSESVPRAFILHSALGPGSIRDAETVCRFGELRVGLPGEREPHWGAPKDPPSPCPWTQAPHEASRHWTVGMSSTEPGNSGCLNLQPVTAHLLGLRDTSEPGTQGHRHSFRASGGNASVCLFLLKLSRDGFCRHSLRTLISLNEGITGSDFLS